MSGTNNPFQTPDYGLPSQEPGLLGVSPATWANIAALGAGAIQGANQRTGSGHLANGTGLAGGLAGAAQGYLGSVNQGAQLRSQIAHQGAQTQTLNFQNQIQQAQLPYQLAIARQNADFAQNPQHARDWLNQFTQGQGQLDQSPNPFTQGAFTQPAGTGNPDGLANAVHQLESGGRTNTPGIMGDGGQAYGPGQVHAGALADVNKRYGTNFTLPQLAANPQLGTQVGDAYLQLQKERFGGNPAATLAAYNAGPGATQQALQSGQGLAALPQSTQNYVQRGLQLAGGVPSAGQVSPWALGQSQDLGRRADALAFAQRLGLNIPGDPAFNRSQALEYTKAGLDPLKVGAEELAKGQVALEVQPKLKQAEADIERQNAGPIARAKAIGGGVKPEVDRFGNLYQLDNQGNIVYRGRGSEVKEAYDPASGNFVYTEQGGLGVGAPGNLQTPGKAAGGAAAPAGSAQTGTTAAPSPEGALVAKPGPLSAGFAHERGIELGKQFNDTDTQAEHAKESNYLVDNARNDLATWNPDDFAPYRAKAQGILLAVGHSLGVSDENLKTLSTPLSDYTAFAKSVGNITREAVRETSSRAAVQEYKLIGDTLPAVTTPKEALLNVFDQIQGLNDYKQAKQVFQQQYKGNPQDFEVQFNSRVSPTSFLFNRMGQTPEGQETLQRILSQVSQNKEGRDVVKRILGNVQYLKQNGLFDSVGAGAPPSGGPTAPPPGQ